MALGIKVVRLFRLNGEQPVRAICDISIDDEFLVKGFTVINGKNGLFVSMPREPGKDGKWYNSAFPLTAQMRQALTETVLAAYEQG